jgi:hypothetical protein
MRKIDVGYAVVYVDDEHSLDRMLLKEKGDGPLEEVVKEVLGQFYNDHDIITDFYKTEGSIQWNYYLLYTLSSDNMKYERYISQDDLYARKLYCDTNSRSFDAVIEQRFPPYVKDDRGVIVCYFNSHSESLDHYINNKFYDAEVHQSYLRVYNEMDTLTEIDMWRAHFINNELLHTNMVFYTHIKQEFGWLKKKFGFLGDNLEIIDLSLGK